MNIFKKIWRNYKTYQLSGDAFGTLIDIPKIKDLDIYYRKFNSDALSLIDSSTLDIGCGVNPRNPFNAKSIYGIDIRENEAMGIKYADLNVEAIPFEDSKFD